MTMQEPLREPRTSGGQDGFTLIELLVVVVIIGVLVAIAVPVYLSYKRGAADKAAQSDLRGAITAVEQYYGSYHSTYPRSEAIRAATFNLHTPANVQTGLTVVLTGKTLMTIYVASASAGSYKICTANTDGNKQYLYDSAVGGSLKPVVITDGNTCAI
jgi:type IV pilus assembly protein PilA